MDKRINKKEIGNRIKKNRQSLGMTQEEFGKLIGSNKYSVSNWENVKNLPNNVRLVEISDFIGITVDELLYGRNLIEIEITNDERKLLDKLAKKQNQSIKNLILNATIYKKMSK